MKKAIKDFVIFMIEYLFICQIFYSMYELIKIVKKDEF